jgi:hypothetical protein
MNEAAGTDASAPWLGDAVLQQARARFGAPHGLSSAGSDVIPIDTYGQVGPTLRETL